MIGSGYFEKRKSWCLRCKHFSSLSRLTASRLTASRRMFSRSGLSITCTFNRLSRYFQSAEVVTLNRFRDSRRVIVLSRGGPAPPPGALRAGSSSTNTLMPKKQKVSNFQQKVHQLTAGSHLSSPTENTRAAD